VLITQNGDVSRIIYDRARYWASHCVCLYRLENQPLIDLDSEFRMSK
jgi:hypothetical protein